MTLSNKKRFDISPYHSASAYNRNEIVIDGKTTATFTKLAMASSYNILVTAVAELKKVNGTSQTSSSSLPVRLSTCTSPDAPSAPNLVEISHHSASLKWVYHKRIAPGATIDDFHVKFLKTNNKGDRMFIGSSIVVSSNNTNHLSIRNLVQGTTYAVSVQVLFFVILSSLYRCLLSIVESFFKNVQRIGLRSLKTFNT